jgi:RHS repeat-associated protein
VRFDYDALGRRTARHDSAGSTLFTWDGMRLLQEQRDQNISTYVYEADSYTPLARIDIEQPRGQLDDTPNTSAAKIYYFHCNINGAPEELTDAQGNIVWQARYQTLGKLLTGKNSVTQNLRMQGQYADNDTGLYYNTFRYYDPDIGRFISEDPIGLEGGLNLYQYAPNTLGWVDPWGVGTLGKHCREQHNRG